MKKIVMHENHSGQNHQQNKPLPNSEDSYRQLINNIHNGYALYEIVLNDQGHPINYRFLEVNPAFEQMTGFKSESLVGHTLLEVMPPTEPGWLDQYGKVALTGESIHFENFDVRINRHFEVTAIRTSSNQLACIYNDITTHKQTEEALRESKLKYQNLFENTQETFFEVSIDGILLDVSPSVQQLSKGQYKRQDLIGKPLFDFYAD